MIKTLTLAAAITGAVVLSVAVPAGSSTAKKPAFSFAPQSVKCGVGVSGSKPLPPGSQWCLVQVRVTSGKAKGAICYQLVREDAHGLKEPAIDRTELRRCALGQTR